MSYIDMQNARVQATGIIDPQNELKFTIDQPEKKTLSHFAGKLQVSDGYTDPNEKAVFDTIDVPARSGIVPEFLLTDSASVIYWDNTGEIVQKNFVDGGAFLRDHVQGTIIIHVAHDIIESSSDVTAVALSNLGMGFADLSFSMGNINTLEGGKNRILGVMGTTTVQKADGSINFHGLNCRTVPDGMKSPNIRQSVAVDGSGVALGWHVSDSDFGMFTGSITGINPGLYDDGTAVLADSGPQGIVGDQEWTNVRISVASDSDLLVFHYGPKKYSSAFAARIGIATENFELLPIAQQSMAAATLTIRGGATSTTNTDDAIIANAIPVRQDYR